MTPNLKGVCCDPVESSLQYFTWQAARQWELH